MDAPLSVGSIEQPERKRVQGKGYLNTITKRHLIDMYEMFYPTFEGYTFFSSTHRILMNIDHTLGYKAYLNKFQRTAIIQSICSDCLKRVSTIPPLKIYSILCLPFCNYNQSWLLLFISAFSSLPSTLFLFILSFQILLIPYFIVGVCVVLMLMFPFISNAVPGAQLRQEIMCICLI